MGSQRKRIQGEKKNTAVDNVKSYSRASETKLFITIILVLIYRTLFGVVTQVYLVIHESSPGFKAESP